jgi:hypothetical protein
MVAETIETKKFSIPETLCLVDAPPASLVDLLA